MEKKILRQRDAIRSKNEEKRAERSVKNEAIRVKYGSFFVLLIKEYYNVEFLISVYLKKK